MSELHIGEPAPAFHAVAGGGAYGDGLVKCGPFRNWNASPKHVLLELLSLWKTFATGFTS